MSCLGRVALTIFSLILLVISLQVGNSTLTTAPDFVVGTISPSPTPADGRATALLIINITPFNGFNGTISLNDSPLPSGLTCGSIVPSSVALPGKATLLCKSSIAGRYWVTITGTSTGVSGQLVRTSRTAFIFTPAPDFSISATSATAVVDGATAVSTVTVNFLNGFVGMVTLSDRPLSQLNCQPLTSVTLATSGQSSLSCTSRIAGSYVVTVSASDGGFLVHNASATFVFTLQPLPNPDVSLAVSASIISVEVGASGTSTLTISPLNGFAGSIQLSASAPNGVACSLSPASVETSGTSTLTCNGTTAGDYAVTVTAMGGATSHSKIVIVHVAALSPVAPAPPSTILGIAPSVFYAIIITMIVAAGTGLVLRMRSRRAVPKAAS